VVLNHAMLSSLASLSTYLQHHQTTPASREFKDAVTLIHDDLANVFSGLDKTTLVTEITTEETKRNLNSEKLSKLSFTDVEAMIHAKPSNEHSYQEAHLVWEQLRWLHSISKKMLELTNDLLKKT